MRIAELFRRDIFRTIEEVVKVDLADDAVIANELDEYVATTHILDEFEKVLDAYQESINKPSETATVWVSGFFGCGKSSWAKTLGYLLWNPTVAGRPAVERFFDRCHAPRVRALLNSIHTQAPTEAVLLNLATGSNVVAREGESVVLPVYRALLEHLGYSRNLLLAELEYTLEGDGRLDLFQQRFAEATGKEWTERRYTGLAKNEASRALHLLDPSTFPQPDSYARSATEPDINADWFARRALELLARRGSGAARLVMVVDEAGQYVARSVQRMLDLQGLAEACQKQMGRLWLVVTSQERLNDVVDSLESKQVELARAQARFPLRVDLLPSDIDEVTGKRVLDKTDAGQQAVRAALAPHRQRLATHTRLASPTRAGDAGEDELVRLYPLLPYQVQLLIDAVSARRTHGGASPMVGGSNRTLIRHAQQLITHPQHGLGNEDVGVLVTLDRSYNLLEELVPTSWRAEVEQVAEKYGGGSLEARILKVVALCSEVPALPLTVPNVAALLHPHVAAESLKTEVTTAAQRLVGDDRLRDSEEGFKLQSPEQKDWEQARRAIDLTQGHATRLRRLLLKQVLTGLSVTRGRTFKVEVTVDGEKIIDGDLALNIEEADGTRRDELRVASRERAQENRVTWVYTLSADTWDALVELHRSRTMIERRDTPSKTPADVELLAEERQRERRHETNATQRFARDLVAGQAIFRGRIEDVDGAELRAAAQRLVADHLEEVYPQLDEFTANLRREDVMTVLRTTNLGALPEALRDDGIRLVRVTPTGYELAADTGPLAALVAEARIRAGYGQEATGAYLERHFADPPYGASVEVVQALCAAALRAGVLEVIHQGQRITNATDARLDQVFGALPRFRAAAFRPPADTDVPFERRVELAERLEEFTGEGPPGHSTDALADALRRAFLPFSDATIRVESKLAGLELPLPAAVSRTRSILERFRSDDDVDVVTSAHATWADLVGGSEEVTRLDDLLDKHLEELRAAQREARRSPTGLPLDLAEQRTELRDLLAAGDLAGNFAPITAITVRLSDARRRAAQEAAERLRQTLEELRATLRSQYQDLGDNALDEAFRRLDGLAPPEDLGDTDAATLTALQDSARAQALSIARQLDELRAPQALAWVRVADLVAEPITTEEELDAALARIREAVADEVADGKQVRLQ